MSDIVQLKTRDVDRAERDPVSVSATPTVSLSAYTASYVIGSKLTLSNAVRVAGGSGVISSVTITDTSKQNAKMDVIFFQSDPTGSTFSDQSPLSLATADLTKSPGAVTVEAYDYKTLSGNSVATIAPVGIVFDIDSGSDLFACLVNRGTPTYTSTSALSLIVGIV
jgi:hypothetical protein